MANGKAPILNYYCSAALLIADGGASPYAWLRYGVCFSNAMWLELVNIAALSSSHVGGYEQSSELMLWVFVLEA